MNTEYDEVMSMICHAARFKMQLNSHKGDITKLDDNEAIKLAEKELAEMSDASLDKNFEKVIIEAGDALNFILAVAVKASREYREERS